MPLPPATQRRRAKSPTPRTIAHRVTVTDAEEAILQARADELGVTVGNLMYGLVVGMELPRPQWMRVAEIDRADLVTQLAAIGNLLNQAVRAINTVVAGGGSLTAVTLTDLRATLVAVDDAAARVR